MAKKAQLYSWRGGWVTRVLNEGQFPRYPLPGSALFRGHTEPLHIPHDLGAGKRRITNVKTRPPLLPARAGGDPLPTSGRHHWSRSHGEGGGSQDSGETHPWTCTPIAPEITSPRRS